MSWPGLRSSAAPSSRARRADSRQQRRRRRHHHPRRAGAGGVKRAGPDRRHADVRRQPAVGIDFVRGERQNGQLGGGAGQPFHRREEEGDVLDRLLDVAVAGHHVPDHAARQAVRGGGHVQRLRGRREAGDDAGGHVHPAAGDGGLQEPAEIERGGGGHSGVRLEFRFRRTVKSFQFTSESRSFGLNCTPGENVQRCRGR